MSEFITDNDRVESIKKWWDKNGTALIIGIVVGLALIYGWQAWQKYQAKQAIEASQAYQTLITTDSNSSQAQIDQANAIIKQFPRSPYAALSSLVKAKVDVSRGKYSDAYDSLMWVVDHAKDASMRQVARIRAARLLLVMNKPQDALALLEKRDDPNFNILIDEVRGDIYAVQQNYAAAKQAYLKAQSQNPNSQVLLPILQLKISSLPANNEQDE